MARIPKQSVSSNESTEAKLAPVMVEVGAKRGIRRINKRVAPVMPPGSVDDGDYTAVTGVAIPNLDYDRAVPVHLQHEAPCLHLHPGDIVNVPDGLAADEAWSLLHRGAIRATTADDAAAHDRADAVEFSSVAAAQAT